MNRYRPAHDVYELGQCSQKDVMQIAKDLGMPVSDLRSLAAKRPGAADFLQKMQLDSRAMVKCDPAASCGTCNDDFAISAAIKAVVDTNWLTVLPLNIFVSSVQTRTRLTRFSNKGSNGGQ